MFAEYKYRPGRRNATADNLFWSTTEADSVLSIGLEVDFNSVVGYLTTEMVAAESSKFAKAIKMLAKNSIIHGEHL